MPDKRAAPIQLGIELECWVIDPNGELAPAGPILEASPARPEFVEPLLEVATPPCPSVPAAIDALADSLREILDVAHAHERRLVPMGTPLADASVPIREDCSARIAIQRTVLVISITPVGVRGHTSTDLDGDDGIALPPFPELRRVVAAAMADGLGAHRVRDHLARFDIEPQRYWPTGARIDGRRRVPPDVARPIARRVADRLERDHRRIEDPGVRPILAQSGQTESSAVGSPEYR